QNNPMFTRSIPPLLALVLISAAAPLYAQSVEDVITKARARLGSEEALNNVETVQFIGVAINGQGEVTDDVILQFKKPTMQRLTVESDNFKRITATNGFEGYTEIIDKYDPLSSGIIVHDAERVRRLIANSLENLYFFRGPYHLRGASVADEGMKSIDGEPCHVIRYSYPGDYHYLRRFNAKTGRVVSTINISTDFETVEEGVIEVDGILFPEQINTYDDEGDLIRAVKFNQIIVNQPLDDSLFDFPDVMSNKSYQDDNE
ncbi:MAG: hypothetical protein AAGF10_06920, partial [Verrucomicrobiota bacterium]